MTSNFGKARTQGEQNRSSDTGNRTPSYRVKGGNVSRYTISDVIYSLLLPSLPHYWRLLSCPLCRVFAGSFLSSCPPPRQCLALCPRDLPLPHAQKVQPHNHGVWGMNPRTEVHPLLACAEKRY